MCSVAPKALPGLEGISSPSNGSGIKTHLNITQLIWIHAVTSLRTQATSVETYLHLLSCLTSPS